MNKMKEINNKGNENPKDFTGATAAIYKFYFQFCI